MAPVKITFNDHSATPPVYVAGSFTNWQPVEIEPVKSENGYIYEKTFDLTPGTYQYKFRLGPGDWWVLDSSSPSNRDASGNENNEITVESEPEPKVESKPEPVSFAAATTLPAVPTPEVSKPEVAQPSQPAEKVVPTPVAAKVVDEEPVAQVNGIHKSEPTKVEELSKAPEVDQFVAKVNGNAVEPVAVQEKPEPVAAPVKVEESASKPVEKTTGEATPSKPVTKESDSNGTSVSSIPAKAQAVEKKGDEPKKESWFARVFLCKSSREVILAATLVSIPVLIAYVIKR